MSDVQPPVALDRHSARLAVNATWLVMLRWAAVVGQLATITVVAGVLDLQLRLGPLLAIVGLTAVTNIGFHIVLARGLLRHLARSPHGLGDRVLAMVMLFDIAALTGLLYFAGGPDNPFAVFYLVNLSLAAVVLSPSWAWALTAATIVCFGILFMGHEPLPVLDEVVENEVSARRGIERESFTVPMVGFFSAFTTCALVIVYFITRVTTELERREAQLRDSEQERAIGEKLEALATLAAGAAHELASPLSTIAIAAKELEYDVREKATPEQITEDVRLIRGEVDRCRQILVRMSADAGQAVGEPWQELMAEQLVEKMLGGMPSRARVQVRWEVDSARTTLALPTESLSQALRGLIQNAIDASPAESSVDLTVSKVGSQLQLRISDQGPGMSEEVRRRAGEPFFTTKQPGEGMGLGLFLARRVIGRLGGSMKVESSPGEGATILVELPTTSASHTAEAAEQ